MKTRPGFDTSPLLDQEFNKAEKEWVKGLETVQPQDEIPELLIHTIKRINKTPTNAMLLAAEQLTGLSEKQILDVWHAMWSRA